MIEQLSDPPYSHVDSLEITCPTGADSNGNYQYWLQIRLRPHVQFICASPNFIVDVNATANIDFVTDTADIVTKADSGGSGNMNFVFIDLGTSTSDLQTIINELDVRFFEFPQNLADENGDNISIGPDNYLNISAQRSEVHVKPPKKINYNNGTLRSEEDQTLRNIFLIALLLLILIVFGFQCL